MTEAPRWRKIAWALVLLPALGQVWLLLGAMLTRIRYRYDLEWMEGGLLHHAARIHEGSGLYVEPSVEFIPYLYTPLYPGLLATLEPVFGISYQVARGVSVLATLGLLGLVYVAAAQGVAPKHRGLSGLSATLGVGLIAASYPFVDGWYDLVRADALFVAMVVGGLIALVAWARAGEGAAGHARVGAAAAILALSFFCKQTGVLYVAAGGAVLLVLNYRRLPVYIGVSGLIGLGGTWILNRASNGWFWTYVFEVHQAHDTNPDRFWKSFANILGEFPIMSLVIALALVGVAIVRRRTGAAPASCQPLLVWSFVFAVSCLVGALGWATQWAHFNAYMPALVTGAIACATAVPALAGVFESLWPGESHPAGRFGPLTVAALVAGQLVAAWWSPSDFTPTARDQAAGDKLIDQIAAIDGEVLIPFHPWYARLAGKRAFVHRMGVKDVTFVKPGAARPGGPPWPVRNLEPWIREARFAAIIWDDRPIDVPAIRRAYRLDDFVDEDARPRTFSGARVVPKEIWLPADPLVPPRGTRVLFNFESGRFDGWTVEGTAWGSRPAAGPTRRQGPVRRYGGRYFLSSMHGGDTSTGTLFSPSFAVTGSRISFRISGGNDDKKLRAELQIDGETVDWATGKNSERMEERGWHVAPYRGKTARIVLIDESKGSWGHLNVDEIWIED